jgi:beta-lactamase regulating signal transducer with metallopeptidase domain
MNRVILLITGIFSVSSLMLVDSAVKGTALLMLAGIAAMILRRDSAATRHLMWLLAIVAMLVVPVLSAMLPQWRVLPAWAGVSPKTVVAVTSPPAIATPVESAVEAPRNSAVVDVQQPVATAHQPAAEVPDSQHAPAIAKVITEPLARSWNWIDLLPLAWAIGFGVLIMRLLAARLMLWNFRRQSTMVGLSTRNPKATDDPLVSALEGACLQLGVRRSVTLLIHPDKAIPVVWGIFRCYLLLPAAAWEWSDEQLRSVLLHELAHVKRRDAIAQLLTQIACALHWFNPLVWLAAWRIGSERERACDDLVLASGVRASVYAGHLLDVVATLSSTRWTQTCGLAMARKSSLEGRLVAVLSKNLNRRGVSVALAAIALAMTVSIAVPTAMLRAADGKAGAPAQPEPLKAEYVRGLDLSKVAVQGSEAAYQSMPEVFVPDRANPRSWNYRTNVFLMPLDENTWLQYPAGSGHFYITLRHEGRPDSEQTYGPIAGDPFEVLKLEELLRERLKPGSTSDNARYRLRLMFRTGEPGLVRRVWQMIEPELAFKFTAHDENFYQRFELFEGVRDALRDRAEAFRNPELKDVVAQATQRVKAAEAEFDELNGFGDEAGAGDGYESATYLQPKIAAKIPEALWGKPLDGLRLALVPRQSTPATDWNELPRGTALATSITVEARQELNYQLVVENVSDHEIKLCGYALGEEVHRTLEVLDSKGKPADIQGIHTSIMSIPSYWRLKPGERYLLSMPAVHFMPPKSDSPSQGMGYFVKNAAGEYTLRCSYVFGLYDNTRHRHIPKKGIWVGQLTTGSQLITVADPAGAKGEAPQQPQKPKTGAKIDPAAEAKVKWGDPANGLRAALVIRNSANEPNAAGMPDLYMLVQNVSDAPIHLSDTVAAAPNVRYMTVQHDDVPQGRTKIDKPTQADVTLKPREITYLLMIPRGDRPTRGQSLAAGMLKEAHMILFGEITIEKAPAGAWTGTLTTGYTGGAAALIEEPVAQKTPQASTAAKFDPVLEQNLKWGKTVDGLRAAVVLRYATETPKAGDLPELYIALQNVSDAAIRLTDTSAQEQTRLLYLKVKGDIKMGLGANDPKLGDRTLGPREVTLVAMFNDGKNGDGRTIGQLMAEGMLQDTHQSMVINFTIDKAPAGSWTGKLATGDSTGAVAAGQPQPNDKSGQALLALWQHHVRANGSFPGGLVGRLGDKVNEFIRNNTGDAGGDPYAKKMMPLVPRIDASRDWKPDEVVALMDDIAAVTPIPLETTMDDIVARTFKTGTPLPKALTSAPWGEAQPSGLRMAWLLEPRAQQYEIGTPLKSRILILNAGKETVVFRTRTWHQVAHKASDANGRDIKVDSTFWTTIGRLMSYRLQPGEFIELTGAGIGVGANKNDEDWQNTRVGSWVSAKAGDDVTLTSAPVSLHDLNELPPKNGEPAWWLEQIKADLSQDLPLPTDAEERKRLVYRAGLEVFGTPLTAEEINAFVTDREPTAMDSMAKRFAKRPGITPFAGDLTSGPTKFRVLPPDPDAAKKPRTANNPGRYTLSQNAVFVVTRRPVGERIVNEAKIEFVSPDEKTPELRYEIKLSDGYNTWAAAWVRGTSVLWVRQKGTVRSYDFTNPAQVKETTLEGPSIEKEVPMSILDAIPAILDVPGAPASPKPATEAPK